MVRLGFICEGATEKLIVESYQFRQLLLSNNIELIEPVIDANGGGNLLPKNIEQFVSILSNPFSSSILICFLKFNAIASGDIFNSLARGKHGKAKSPSSGFGGVSSNLSICSTE